jgi:hypothetical protein
VGWAFTSQVFLRKNKFTGLFGMVKKITTALRWMLVLPTGLLASYISNVIAESILCFLNAPDWMPRTLSCVYAPILGLFTSAAIAPKYKFITAATIALCFGLINIISIGWVLFLVFAQKGYHFVDNARLAWAPVQVFIYVFTSIACCLSIRNREKENLKKRNILPEV